MTIGHVYPLSNIAKAQKSTYNGSGNPLPDDLIRVGSEGRWPSIPEVTKHKKAFVEGKATKELQQPVRELIAYFEGMRSESPYPPIRLVKVEHPPLQYADKISINNTPQKNKDPVDPSRLPEPNSTQSNSTQPNNGRVSSLLPQSSPCLQLQPIPQSSQVRESVESNGQSGDGALAVQNVKGTGIGETPLSRTSSVDSGYEADKKDTGNNMPTAMEVRNSIIDLFGN